MCEFVCKEINYWCPQRGGTVDLDYARLCYTIGNVLIALHDFNDALEMCNKALAICEKVLGKEHPDTAASYSNTGLVMLAMMGDNVGALEMCNKGLVIHLKVLDCQTVKIL